MVGTKMVYETDGMVLTCISQMRHGTVNDVIVCQDTASPSSPLYTLIIVKDPVFAKRLLSVIEQSEKPTGTNQGTACIHIFSQNDALCFLFPYRPERRLSVFGAGQFQSPRTREKIAINLVMECLSTPYPYPLLYLILCQDNIQLQSDNTIYLTPFVDLSGLDVRKDEADCAGVCVSILLDYLDGGPGEKKLKSFELLRKKLNRLAYQSFPELYRDIRITMLPEEGSSIFEKLKGVWIRNRDVLFRILLWCMGTVIVITLIILISQFLFGDVPLFRLFENRFSKIGTETLH